MSTVNSTETYTVPEAFKPIDPLAEQFVEFVSEALALQFDLDDSNDLERVENKARPGFFPFTDGGWMAQPSSYLSSAYGSGRHAGLLSVRIEEAQASAMQSYLDDNDLTGTEWEAMSDEQREAFYDYENEWLDQFYVFEVRACYYDTDNSRNKSGEPEVQLVVMVNFDEYGRDGKGVKLWEVNLPVSQATEAKLTELAEQAAEIACSVTPWTEPTE